MDAVPAKGRLHWTSFADLEGDSSPADPLRFDMYIQRLGNILLPGITNRTERVRYLSMVCAGLLQTSWAGAAIRERRRAFLPFERGWALAMTLAADGRLKLTGEQGEASRGLRPEFRGLRGANRVLRHWRTLGDVDGIKPTNYTLLQGQDAQGGLGAYLVTLREFGFIQPDALTVTPLGRELAAAFAPKGRRGVRLSMLAEEREVSRRHLGLLGGDLLLGRPSGEERQIVRAAVFDHPRSVVGEVVRRIEVARPGALDSRERLAAIADPRGDELERAAAFAVAFDPLRVAALSLFAGLGSALVPLSGATSITRLATDGLERDAAAVRDAAAGLASVPGPRGLEPIVALARDCSEAETLEQAVRSLIAFHRREARSWIVAEGRDRYRVGRYGSFDPPPAEFNGYTLSRAYQLHDDLGRAA
jgi:hypothetical protein